MASRKFRAFATKITQKFIWDATVEGGTKETSIVVGSLPANALVVGGFAYVNTTPVGDTTTISLGYSGATAALFPATTATSLTSGSILKLLPGTLDIGAGQAITTVDTPAEIVAITRTGHEFASFATTANKNVLVTLSKDNNLTAGKITFFVEYYLL